MQEKGTQPPQAGPSPHHSHISVLGRPLDSTSPPFFHLKSSCLQKAAEWINGLKWLMQKLGLGTSRRRSSHVFSFYKVLGNELKDQLKWNGNCLKFFKYVYMDTHTGEKREKGGILVSTVFFLP